EEIVAVWPIWRCLSTAALRARLRHLLGKAGESGHTARSHNLPMRLIPHAATQKENSARQPRNAAEFTGRNACMIAEKPREMRRNLEAEPCADISDARIAS